MATKVSVARPLLSYFWVQSAAKIVRAARECLMDLSQSKAAEIADPDISKEIAKIHSY